MEMDVCGSNEAQQIGESLTSFFQKMSGGDNDDKPAPAAAPPKKAPPVTRAPPPQRSSIPSSSTSRTTNPNERYNATSGASRRQQEMSSMFGSGSSGSSGGGGAPMSVKDRMKMFNNNQKFECDPTAFALKLNKQEKGELTSFMPFAIFLNSMLGGGMDDLTANRKLTHTHISNTSLHYKKIHSTEGCKTRNYRISQTFPS